jgi:phage terminase small subunit
MAILTEKQERFACALHETGNQAEAYRQAYPASVKWSDSTVYANASRLASNSKVLARLDALRTMQAEKSLLTVDTHLAELERLKVLALGAGNITAAIAAEVARGKVAGFYEKKPPVQIVNNAPYGEFKFLTVLGDCHGDLDGLG